MNKIMIVDDMPIFLEYLRGCIDWNAYGFEICCEAHDGREALEKMSEFYPDVVLTDITMPYLNGLELSEEIIKNYPDTSVVLITGNNEFEYARKAVKIGVCDYIVKPFEKEELILSLLKLQDNISKALESTKPQEGHRYDELRSLIYAGGDEDIAERLFSGKSENEGYLLALIRFELNSFGESRENLMNWENLVGRLLGDKLEIDGEFQIFHDYENNIVVLMRFDKTEELDSYKGYEFTDIIGVVKNQLGYDLSIALSKAQDIRDVKRAYEKALGTVTEGAKGQLIDLRNEKEVKLFSSLDAIVRLNKDIESLQAEDAEDAINAIWDKIGKGEDSKRISSMSILTSVISILMTNIINSGFSVEKIYGEDFLPDKFFVDSASAEEMKEKVIYLFKKRIEFEKGKKTSKGHDIARAAKEYIEENYKNSELSISEISEKLCVNQTYLRKMFKSEMDMTLSEYITSYRMQEAKRLITSTDEKLSSVAEQVGYSDVSYFSNVFKKYYGISPRSMTRE